MPSTRRQKAKARKSREMDMLSDIENMDVMLGNDNPIEKELADAIEQSSVQGDVESTAHLGNHYASFTYENNPTRQDDVRQSFETFSNEFNLRLSQEMDAMMSMMHSQISRAINNAMTERVIPEIQNIVSSLSSSRKRDTEASISPNSQENRECSSGFKSNFAKKDSQYACDLRDTADHNSHYTKELNQKGFLRNIQCRTRPKGPPLLVFSALRVFWEKNSPKGPSFFQSFATALRYICRKSGVYHQV